MISRLSSTLGAITVFFIAYSTQAYSQEVDLKLKTVEELLALQRTVEAESAKAGKTKTWGSALSQPAEVRAGGSLFEDDFQDLSNWHHESIGSLSQPERNVMQLNCVGSEQGSKGCMAFCRKDFPDSIDIEFDLRVLSTNGLVITFIACQGRRGEDMLNELPQRDGTFEDYVFNSELRSYHVSSSRYDDVGRHTGVSNWRRNPGLFLMAQQLDLCKEPRKWYHIRITKLGRLLQMHVDGQFAGGFYDRDEIPEPLPRSGKIGFRAIGREVLAQIKNFKVSSVKSDVQRGETD